MFPDVTSTVLRTVPGKVVFRICAARFAKQVELFNLLGEQVRSKSFVLPPPQAQQAWFADSP